MLLNNEAWEIVKRPGAARDQAEHAVKLIRRALNRQGTRWELWNTLGVAHLRARDLRAAINAFEKSMKLHEDEKGDANDWFPLAIVHWSLEDKVAARKWFDQAMAWMADHPDIPDHSKVDLLNLRDEAVA